MLQLRSLCQTLSNHVLLKVLEQNFKIKKLKNILTVTQSFILVTGIRILKILKFSIKFF